jgi:hypothetical protein
MEREGESDGRALRFGLSSGNELLRTRISACVGRSQSGQVGSRSPKSDSRPCQVLFSEYRPVHVLPLALFVPRPCLLPHFSPPRRVISTRGGALLSTRLAPEGFPLSRQSSRPPQPPLQGQEGFPSGGDSSAPSSGRGRSKEAKRPVLGQFWGSSGAVLWRLASPSTSRVRAGFGRFSPFLFTPPCKVELRRPRVAHQLAFGNSQAARRAGWHLPILRAGSRRRR